MTNKEKYEQSKHIYLCHESELWTNREGAAGKTNSKYAHVIFLIKQVIYGIIIV